MKPEVPRDFYESLFDNTLDGLAYCQMIFDAQENPVDWIYIRVNKNFEKLTGLKGATGKKVTELVPGITTSNPELFKTYGRVSLTGTSERFEVYVEPLSRWFLVSVYSPSKKFFVAVFQNITDQKKIEKELQNASIATRNVLEDLEVEKEAFAQAKAKDEALLGSIGDGVIATDAEEKIILMNQSAQEMLGWHPEEMAGRLLFDAVPIEDEKGNLVPREKRPTYLALAGTTTTTTTGPTYNYVRKDKTKFPVAIKVSPVVIDGKIVGTVEVFRDITREKDIDLAKTEFVSLASHQLRTPLTTISWYTEMMLNGDMGQFSPVQKKYLQEVYAGNKRMTELVNTLLDVSHLELGTFANKPEQVLLKDVAESVLVELNPQITAKKLSLDKYYDPSLSVILIDPRLTRMIFQNLLENAVKYVSINGKIRLDISMERSNALIKVWNNGIGIPKEAQTKIFTKLFRDDLAKKIEPDGNGLGLYIVKSIVEKSGGKVWFESEEKGTTFFVTFPTTTNI